MTVKWSLTAYVYQNIRSLITHLDDFIAKSTPLRAVAGDLFNTTYGNGWYYFAEQSAHTPETYGTCFFLRINNWSFRLAIGTTKAIYTNVNIGQGFGEWVKFGPPLNIAQFIVVKDFSTPVTVPANGLASGSFNWTIPNGYIVGAAHIRVVDDLYFAEYTSINTGSFKVKSYNSVEKSRTVQGTLLLVKSS